MIAAELLDQLLALAEEPPSAGAVSFSGADPVLPSPLRLGEASAAAIGATGLLAARVHAARGGPPQEVRVAVDAAAAALRSSRYVRVDGAEPRRAGGGGLGVYRTRDERWMYFQRLFAHHRQRMMSVLQCPEDEAAIGVAVRGWDGLALEEAIVAAGASGGMVRSAAEWATHPQAAALRGLPLLEIERFGNSPPEPRPAGARPLSGVRVLDLTRVLAGPTCGRTLAEHGADVLRIGSLQVPDNELMMRDTGFGKRSAALDLTAAPDVARLRGLVPEADVFVQGYRPGSLDARGFGPDTIVALRPGIVYVTVSAFSHAGPWQARRGFDSVVQAVSGIAADHAVDGRPRFAPANPLDYLTGYLAAFGALVALQRRANLGGSYLVRVSLAQTGRWLAGLPRVDAAQVAGQPAELSAERLAELQMVSETPFGRLRHLRPVAELSETPAYWARPSVPLDHDPPEWR